MSARPLFPERLMIQSGAVVALVLVGAMVMAAGCISQKSFPEKTTSTQTLCTTPGNINPDIIINPIGNHTVGDVFEINGTTDLDNNTKIILNLHEQLVSSLPARYYPLSGTFGCVTIQKNPCRPNSWSYSVNLSGYHTNKYWVQLWVEPKQNATSLEAYNDTWFWVYPE